MELAGAWFQPFHGMQWQVMVTHRKACVCHPFTRQLVSMTNDDVGLWGKRLWCWYVLVQLFHDLYDAFG